MVVRVTVIGELGLEIDGQRVPPPRGRPACALLAWLALHPGSHPRELVAARLWPDVLDSSARTSLRSALARVTKALGIDAVEALVTTRDPVGLAAAPAVTVDAAEFADLLRN